MSFADNSLVVNHLLLVYVLGNKVAVPLHPQINLQNPDVVVAVGYEPTKHPIRLPELAIWFHH